MIISNWYNIIPCNTYYPSKKLRKCSRVELLAFVLKNICQNQSQMGSHCEHLCLWSQTHWFRQTFQIAFFQISNMEQHGAATPSTSLVTWNEPLESIIRMSCRSDCCQSSEWGRLIRTTALCKKYVIPLSRFNSNNSVVNGSS